MRAAVLTLAALAVGLGGAGWNPASAQTARTVTRSAEPDTMRVIVPTEGGVLYYRAGPGRGVVFQRDRREAAQDSLAEAVAEVAQAQAVLDAVTEAKAALAGDSAAVARLDRVERAARRSRDEAQDRLAQRRDQLAREDTPRDIAVVPVPVQTDRQPTEPGRPTPAPLPGVTLPDVPDPDVDFPPVTVEEVERAFLDTGLFRSSRVPFEFGKATLLPEAERVLDAVGQALVRAPSLRITVDGHTDAISSEAFNQGLSERRAASVRGYLVGRFGVDPSRLVARGFGETQPIATNETETGRALNRRVEFVVIGGAQRVPVGE